MAGPVAAPPPAISTALSQSNVRVTSGARGARIAIDGAVFDAQAQPSDVVVLVRGPDQPIRIARKRRVAGLWVNGRPVRFEGAPGFYRAASTRPLAQIAPAATLRRMGAGVDNLVIDAPAEPRVEARYGARDVVVSRGPDYENWRAAAAQLRRNRGLYAEDAAGVRFVDKHLFRADIDLPAAAPTGKYRAEIFLFQDGRPVASQARELTVEKGGPERALYLFAKQRPWLYGLASVALALAAGWAASVAFRRT